VKRCLHRACLVVVSLAMGIAPSPTVRAQGLESNRAAAARLFREGAALFARGEFAAAARAFEASQQEVPRAAPIYNAALAWDAAGDAPRAADDYEAALTRTDLNLHGAVAQKAQGRLRELEATLGIADVLAPGEARITLAQANRVAPPVHLHLLPGRYRVVIELATGDRQESFVEVLAGARSLFTAAPPSSTLGPPTVASPQSSIPGPPPPTPRHSGPDVRRSLAFALLGSSGVFAGSAIAFGVLTLRNLDAFRQSNDLGSSLRARAVEFRTLTNIAWVMAGATAVTGGVLLLTIPRSARATTAALWVEVDAAGLRFAGSF
jgi:tetratricopeptide (TPR) repeat protein